MALTRRPSTSSSLSQCIGKQPPPPAPALSLRLSGCDKHNADTLCIEALQNVLANFEEHKAEYLGTSCPQTFACNSALLPPE